MEYFENLEPLLKTFWFIAIPPTVIFIIQMVMTFIGVDSSDGMESDFHSDMGEAPFELFSLRNLVNFLLGFSWTGIAFYDTITSKPILIIVSFLVGLAFVYLFFLIIKQVQKLAEDNSFKIAYTLNKSAEVYLTIPEKKSGKGKIIISVNGSVHELDAMTESDKIKTGTLVTVTKIDNNTPIVETIKI